MNAAAVTPLGRERVRFSFHLRPCRPVIRKAAMYVRRTYIVVALCPCRVTSSGNSSGQVCRLGHTNQSCLAGVDGDLPGDDDAKGAPVLRPAAETALWHLRTVACVNVQVFPRTVEEAARQGTTYTPHKLRSTYVHTYIRRTYIQ